MKKYAEILVVCGYGDYSFAYDDKGKCLGVWHNAALYYYDRTIDSLVAPFADTLEARRQADAIEDWLWQRYYKNHQEPDIWSMSMNHVENKLGLSRHQWRLDRIKWCVESLDE